RGRRAWNRACAAAIRRWLLASKTHASSSTCEPWAATKTARWWRRFERSRGPERASLLLRRIHRRHALAAPGLERQASHHLVHQRLEPIARGRETFGDPLDGRPVVALQTAAKRVGQHLLRQTSGEVGKHVAE